MAEALRSRPSVYGISAGALRARIIEKLFVHTIIWQKTADDWSGKREFRQITTLQ